MAEDLSPPSSPPTSTPTTPSFLASPSPPPPPPPPYRPPAALRARVCDLGNTGGYPYKDENDTLRDFDKRKPTLGISSGHLNKGEYDVRRALQNGFGLGDSSVYSGINNLAITSAYKLNGYLRRLRIFGGQLNKGEKVPLKNNTRNPKKDEPKKPPDIKSRLQLYQLNSDIELQPGTRRLVKSAHRGLRKGNNPIKARPTGGTYYMRDETGNTMAGIFKPADEDAKAVNAPRGLKKGTKVGSGASHEVAVFLLDHSRSGPWVHGDTKNGFSTEPLTVMFNYKCTWQKVIVDGDMKNRKGFSGVPLTVMVTCQDRAFNNPKIGSLQKYIQNCKSCAVLNDVWILPVEEVHKIAVLDLRVGNADRHAGNILWKREEDGRLKLIPIDHSYCFPESFEDFKFVWLEWPQAHQQFSVETVHYIKSLDAEEDIKFLRSNGLKLSGRSLRNLRILTSLLKEGADRGLSPYEIGHILCRGKNKNEESVIEKTIAKVDLTLTSQCKACFLITVSKFLGFELDKVSKRPLEASGFVSDME